MSREGLPLVASDGVENVGGEAATALAIALGGVALEVQVHPILEPLVQGTQLMEPLSRVGVGGVLMGGKRVMVGG